MINVQFACQRVQKKTKCMSLEISACSEQKKYNLNKKYFCICTCVPGAASFTSVALSC